MAKPRPSGPQKSIRERAIEDGLYAEVEAKKQAALGNHMKALARDLDARTLDQLDEYVQASVVPRIKTFTELPTTTGNSGLPPGLTREAPRKVR